MSCRTWRGARQRSSVWGRTISSWVLVAISDRSVPRCCSPAATASPQWPAPQWPARRGSSLLSPRPRSASRSTPTPSRCSFPLPLFFPAPAVPSRSRCSFPLFASLLSDVTMLMVEQARAALARSGALMQEASRAQGRSEEDVQSIGLRTLEEPLIDAPASHSAVISVDHAAGCGLPADRADVGSERWRLIWRLRTRHCVLGCWPMGGRAIHEGARASHAG